MATSSMIIAQAGQTVIGRDRPALMPTVDERTHPSMAATHEVQVENIDGRPHPDSRRKQEYEQGPDVS